MRILSLDIILFNNIVPYQFEQCKLKYFNDRISFLIFLAKMLDQIKNSELCFQHLIEIYASNNLGIIWLLLLFHPHLLMFLFFRSIMINLNKVKILKSDKILLFKNIPLNVCSLFIWIHQMKNIKIHQIFIINSKCMHVIYKIMYYGRICMNLVEFNSSGIIFA